MKHWTVIIRENCRDDMDCHGDLKLFHVEAGTAEQAYDKAVQECHDELTFADDYETLEARREYAEERYKVVYVFAGWHDAVETNN